MQQKNKTETLLQDFSLFCTLLIATQSKPLQFPREFVF